MPYCAECGYEYVEGIQTCPDCQATLVEGERLLCESCQEQITEESTFCPHCGIVLGWSADGDIEILCADHKRTEAIGRCVMCGKPVCEECAHRRQRRIFCANDEHEKMAFDWISVKTTTTEYEAEMIKANLEGASIEAIVLAQSDRMFFTTMGDVAVTEVMVKKENADEAREFLRSTDAIEDEGNENTDDADLTDTRG